MNEITVPQTLMDAIKQFSDPAVCHEFMVNFRWPGGVVCPYCQCDRLSFISTRNLWHCKDCKKRISVKVGTVMEDSPLPLEKWFAGIFLITNAKNGISSCEIARALGVTQKTAWFLLMRIRFILDSGSMNKMTGSVEADETFVGGLEKNKHFDKKLRQGRGGVGKQIVMGILERAAEMDVSNIRTKVIPDTTQETLQGESKGNVAKVQKSSQMRTRVIVASVMTTSTGGSITRSSTLNGAATATAWRTTGVCSSVLCMAPTPTSTHVTCSPTSMSRIADTTTGR